MKFTVCIIIDISIPGIFQAQKSRSKERLFIELYVLKRTQLMSYARSTASAIPIPPPIHKVARPFFASLRFIS